MKLGPGMFPCAPAWTVVIAPAPSLRVLLLPPFTAKASAGNPDERHSPSTGTPFHVVPCVSGASRWNPDSGHKLSKTNHAFK